MTLDDVMAEILAYGSIMAAYRGVSRTSEDLHADVRERIKLLISGPAEPVAWRVTDGEGSFDYADEPVSGFALQVAAQYGREYVPLYLHPPADELARLRAENERLKAGADRFQFLIYVADPAWSVGLFESAREPDEIVALIDAKRASA